MYKILLSRLSSLFIFLLFSLLYRFAFNRRFLSRPIVIPIINSSLTAYRSAVIRLINPIKFRDKISQLPLGLRRISISTCPRASFQEEQLVKPNVRFVFSVFRSPGASRACPTSTQKNHWLDILPSFRTCVCARVFDIWAIINRSRDHSAFRKGEKCIINLNSSIRLSMTKWNSHCSILKTL